jgi:hypothetical protein
MITSVPLINYLLEQGKGENQKITKNYQFLSFGN